MKDDIRMSSREWSKNLWNRVKALFGGLDTRVATIETANYIPSAQKGASGGVAELDNSGHVPSSQLPSYVDDMLEYSSRSAFPSTGETGKIYVAQDTNLTYRWTGSGYVEISPSLALGETSSTAYRGDRGKAAYDHAQAHGSAYASGLYLIQTNAEGHVIAATAVQKSDIVALGLNNEDVGAMKYPLIGTAVDLEQPDNSSGQPGNSSYMIRMRDINGSTVGAINFTASSDGVTRTRIWAENYVNNQKNSKGISVGIGKNGEAYYQIDSPNEFRVAISAQLDVGLYIDAQGYICQRIGSDT